MLKAYKYRLYPSKEQEQYLVQSMGCARYIFNKALDLKSSTYRQSKKSLSIPLLMKTLLLQEKQDHEWLRLPAAQSLQASLWNLDDAYQNFFKKRAGFPQFKSKHDHQSLTYPQNVEVDFKRSKIKLPKIGEIFCRFDREFNGKVKTCTVSREPSGKFFISVLVDNKEPLPPKPPINIDQSVGIDLGLTHFAILSDGSKIDNPRFLKTLLKRLKVLQRRASRKVKGSHNKRKAHLKAALLHERIKNQRANFLHQVSSKIIGENQTIFLEDLNVAGMLKNRKLAFSISDVSWSKFVSFLQYKAEWYGKNVVQIGRFEPSSKSCSVCGVCNDELSDLKDLKIREWHCVSCNAHHDRDINAAINIKKFGLAKVHSGSERPAEPAEMPTSTSITRSKQVGSMKQETPNL
jgi:putative transposase